MWELVKPWKLTVKHYIEIEKEIVQIQFDVIACNLITTYVQSKQIITFYILLKKLNVLASSVRV